MISEGYEIYLMVTKYVEVIFGIIFMNLRKIKGRYITPL